MKLPQFVGALFVFTVAGGLAAWAFALDSLAAQAEGDPLRGARDFEVCAACHSIEAGRHMTGPSLADAYNRKAGTATGFRRYSDALRNSGVTWDAAALDHWLANPAQFIPGTEMLFAGLKDAAARADLIAFLKSVSEGKAPQTRAARGGMGGMMGAAERPNLKHAPPPVQVVGLRHCGDSYFVTTAEGRTHKFWEQNLRLKTDTSAEGPPPHRPALLPAGMQGDRASLIFASPGEISPFVNEWCE